jgi:hypothetical protein
MSMVKALERSEFGCESCDQGFSSFEELERHVVEDHLSMSNKPTTRHRGLRFDQRHDNDLRVAAVSFVWAQASSCEFFTYLA